MTSTLYLERASPIHRLNPVTKLVALLCLIVVVFAISQWWWSVAVLVLVIVPVAVASRVGVRLVQVGAVLLLPILLALFLVQGLTFPGGRTVLWEWGPLALTTEGLMFALTIGARIVCLVLASVLLVFTTHPGDLMTALTEKGLSPKFSYIISSTLQLIPLFRDRANSIILAQQARGLAVPRNPLRRLPTLLPLLGPLVLGMFTEVEERSTAMEARGFGSTAKRSVLVPVADTARQRVARWLMLVLALAAAATAIVGALS